ncbi:DUF6369 family protein [Pseudomonas nitroreducens]|uniref:DUF6369 family protein n=1 Tax=Pseudomonas nitroreducens TaxID=46680 RepID=UPI00112FEB20|nr:DUF6369 family protein [Pseudomonas nitroreducens]
MTYFALSFLFLIFGILRQRGLTLFIIIMATLPFSNSLSQYFYKFGLYSYDYFFAGAFIAHIARNVKTDHLGLIAPKWPSILFITIVAYAAVALMAGKAIDVYFLRDLRPAVFSAELAMAAFIIKTNNLKLSEDSVFRILILAGASNLIWLSLSISGIISSEDEYYTKNNYKYFDASSYISALFVIYYLTQRSTPQKTRVTKRTRRIQLIAILVSLLSIILSGYRTLVLATAISALIGSIKNPAKLIATSTVILISIISFIYLSNLYGAERVLDGTTASGVLTQLYTRYEPALNIITSFTPTNYVLGAGFSTVFEVSWFGYRELDTTNNFVDSAYLTFFAKYGMVGILMLAIIAISFRNIAPKQLSNHIVVYLLVLFSVYCISYQAASVGIITGCLLLRSLPHQDSRKNHGTSI